MSNNYKNIAVLTTRPLWPVWLDAMVDKILKLENIENIQHFYLPGPDPDYTFNLCAYLFHKLEARSYNAAGINAFSPVSKQTIQSAPIEELQTCAADLIICEGGISPNFLKDLRTSLDHHIWEFDESWSTGLPANAARAMLRGKGYVTLTLNDITKPEIKTLYQTISQISSLSLNRSIHQHFMKAAEIPARILKNQTHQTIPCPDYKPLTPLTRSEGFALSSAALFRRLKHAITKPNNSAWALGIYEHQNIQSMTEALKAMKQVIPLPGRFWADPFAVYHDGQYFLFFEEFEYAHGLGKIMAAEMDMNGFSSDPVTVLSESRHLSYPHVFSYEDTWYMVPESGDSERIDLYEASEFPYQWEHKKNLMTGLRAFDATLYYHQGKWWLFCTIAEKTASDYDELHVFFSDDFRTGKWTPHPLNPVVSDVRSARPAGPLFKQDGSLYRPAQDSRERYGYGLVICEILELTPQIYRERIIERITPESRIPGIRGIHTFSCAAGLSAVDFININTAKSRKPLLKRLARVRNAHLFRDPITTGQ